MPTTPSDIAPSVDETLTAVEEQFICPKCGAQTNYRCRLCGATRTTNAVSGNVIWMLNGRVVAAFKDSREAWVRMATEYRIPREEWPVAFQDSTAQGAPDADF